MSLNCNDHNFMLYSQRVHLQRPRLFKCIKQAHRLILMVFFCHIDSTDYLKYVIIDNYSMIGEDEGVILEEDSEDEEGYVFAGQGNFLMFQIIFCVCIYILCIFLDSCS